MSRKQIFGSARIAIAATLQIFFVATATTAVTPALEVIPVVTWQGISLSSYQIESVSRVRSELSQFNFVHFINPVYLMRGTEQSTAIRTALTAVLRESDAVGMHIAPMRDWSLYSKVKPGSGKNLYGQVQEACDNVCGLDQEMAGLSRKDIAAMLTTAMDEFRDAGLGQPKLALFEEGLVPIDVWTIARDFGIKEDWSGFHLEGAKDIMQKYPVFRQNERMATELGIERSNDDLVSGRRLDFLRFGILLDAASAEDVQKTVAAATEFAKTHKRNVTVPLLMTAHSVVHVQHLLLTATEHLKAAAAVSGIEISSWNTNSARTWDRTRLTKGIKVPPKSIAQPAVKVDLVETSTEERDDSLESRLLNEPPTILEVPAEQPVFPSHAREMSH